MRQRNAPVPYSTAAVGFSLSTPQYGSIKRMLSEISRNVAFGGLGIVQAVRWVGRLHAQVDSRPQRVDRSKSRRRGRTRVRSEIGGFTVTWRASERTATPVSLARTGRIWPLRRRCASSGGGLHYTPTRTQDGKHEEIRAKQKGWVYNYLFRLDKRTSRKKSDRGGSLTTRR